MVSVRTLTRAALIVLIGAGIAVSGCSDRIESAAAPSLPGTRLVLPDLRAAIGDPEYQPGPFDGGTAADQIATLSDFQVIDFAGGSNSIDAAIALSSTSVLDNATPADDGYGMPNATIYGDANGDRPVDDVKAQLGLNVQKYGRTTHLTHGQITGVNATVTVCYDHACLKSPRYRGQLIMSPGGFSGGGDSGSLIVTDDANLNPLPLLFARSATLTIANRIH